MGAITPPPIITRLRQAPPVLGEGDQMEFTLWMGPLPVRWLAQIESVSPAGFTDRQVRGPFASWAHRHTFRELGPGRVEVQDEVRVEFRRGLLWGLVGRAMWRGLPVLFAYRAWKTRRLLESAPR